MVMMSVSGYSGRWFEPRQHQYVVCFSKTLYPRCFSRLNCEMSTRWGQPREGCSVLSFSEEIVRKNDAFFTRQKQKNLSYSKIAPTSTATISMTFISLHIAWSFKCNSFSVSSINARETHFTLKINNNAIN